MTPADKKEQLLKYFHDKLFREGFPRETIKDLSKDFSLLVCEECAKKHEIEFINELIHELKK